jgi:hypothetical protein
MIGSALHVTLYKNEAITANRWVYPKYSLNNGPADLELEFRSWLPVLRYDQRGLA